VVCRDNLRGLYKKQISTRIAHGFTNLNFLIRVISVIAVIRGKVWGFVQSFCRIASDPAL
jgi:hypothetical protein